jgi:zinc protease
MQCAKSFLFPVLSLILASPAFADLPIQQWRTQSGANVLFVESRSLPMLDIAVEFPAGSSRDQADTSGLASLTLRLMRMGTRSMSEDQISEQLADVGAGLGSRFDVDRAGYALRTLSSERERTTALRVLRDVLQTPSFAPETIEREKSRIVSALRESEIQPAAIVEREFRELMYGMHPYALAPNGKPETVAAITPQAVERFYRQNYRAADAVVAIIGDVSTDEARQIADTLTSGLTSAAGPGGLLPPVDPLPQSVRRIVPNPASQAHVRIGMPGLSRGDPDYYPLWLGNHIFGGSGFSSRLTGELRQKRGLSYSSYSYFAPYQRPGPFAIGVQTRKDQAAEAVQVIHQALRAFVVDGPTEDEMEAAKQNIIGGFVLRVDSNSEILEYLSMIGFYRLPLDYVDRFPERIAGVTREQVMEAFRRRIDPDRLLTVVVGPD